MKDTVEDCRRQRYIITKSRPRRHLVLSDIVSDKEQRTAAKATEAVLMQIVTAMPMCPQDKWLKDTVEDCRKQRYVTTIGGRRRYLNDIVSGDSKKRAAAERQAVNSAVQVFYLAAESEGLSHWLIVS